MVPYVSNVQEQIGRYSYQLLYKDEENSANPSSYIDGQILSYDIG